MKFIRPKGLLAFLAITGLILVFWYLLIDNAIEGLIEKGGTGLTGAKVDLKEADLSIFPLGITLKGLDLADPDAPMTNMLHVERLAFLMDFKGALLGKVIVNEMTVDGVMVNTPRKSSGAITGKRDKAPRQKEKVAKEGRAPSFPALDMPGAGDILKKEKLETLDRIDALSKTLKVKRAEWDKKVTQLPDRTKIKEYERRISNVKKSLKGGVTEVLKGVKEAKELQKDIDRDLKRFKDVRKGLSRDIKSLKGEIRALKTLPREDLKRLKAKYSLSPEGASNFSGLLFGAKLKEWTGRILKWYEKLSPYMESAEASGKERKPLRAKGLDVKFREFNPRPDFLVKIARVSARIPAGDMKGEIKNITDNQRLTATPLTFNFSGVKLKGIGAVKVDGEVRRLDPAHPEENVSLTVKDYRVKDLALLEGGDFPVAMKDARADIDVRFTRKEERFYADFKTLYKDVVISTGVEKDSPPLARALASTLSGLKSFNMKGDVKGDGDGYDLKLSSNIDSLMKKAVGDMVKKESALFEKKLKSAISEKIKGPMEKLNLEAGDLGGLEKSLSARLQALEGQLKVSEKLKPKGLNIKF